MHCRSCELLVEDELLRVSGVKKAVANQQAGMAEIYFEEKVDPKQVGVAIVKAGYTLGKDEKTWISTNSRDWIDFGIAVFVVADLFLVAKALGLFNLNLTSTHNLNSLPVVFLIGITAGVSTCMALVGGLVLGASARFAEKHPGATTIQKFKPHLFFNLGRIGSYFVLGGLIGYLGSFFQLSSSFLGLLTIGVGVVMLLLGAQLIEMFPILRGITFTLPKSISRLLGIREQSEKEYSHKNSMVAGAMTFFLPCGFTQAMQLFAISSGNPVTGALTLGTFAIGTAPGLLGIGGLTSVVKGTAARLFFRTAGLVVILLALFNLNNGYNLTGFNPGEIVNTIFSPSGVSAASVSDPNVSLVNGVQVVRMIQDSSGYNPNSFTITRNVPVAWIITSKDAHSCAASIVSQTLNIRKTLEPGENVIEFTPTEVGTIRFTCVMGMYAGVFNVVDSQSAAVAPVVEAARPSQTGAAGGGGACGKSGGCGCGGGAARKTQPVVSAEADPKQAAGQAQVIKATFTVNDDIRPNKFTVKRGQPVRFEVLAKENGQGCMGSITVPSLTDKVDILTAGKTAVFEFTPSKTGSFPITCAMGVPRGEILVN